MRATSIACSQPAGDVPVKPLASAEREAEGDARCPVCDESPRVLIAIRHDGMWRLIRDLLDREHGCWQAQLLGREEEVAEAMPRSEFDLVIGDSAAFPACCGGRCQRNPRTEVVVLGPEPDEAYMTAAFQQGAGGWVARDDVAEQLSAEMRSALGCVHGPCPPGTSQSHRTESVHSRTSVR